MQRLEVSWAVRLIYTSLGAKGLNLITSQWQIQWKNDLSFLCSKRVNVRRKNLVFVCCCDFAPCIPSTDCAKGRRTVFCLSLSFQCVSTNAATLTRITTLPVAKLAVIILRSIGVQSRGMLYHAGLLNSNDSQELMVFTFRVGREMGHRAPSKDLLLFNNLNGVVNVNTWIYVRGVFKF